MQNFQAAWVLGALAALAAVVAHILLFKKPKRKLPPGPKGVPIFGSLSIFQSASPHQVLTRMADDYGPVVFLRLGWKPAIVVCSPDAAKLVLKTHDHIFASRPCFAARDHLLYGDRVIAMCPYNSHFKTLRKFATAELLNSSKRLQQFEVVRSDEVSTLVRSIWERSVHSPETAEGTRPGAEVDVNLSMHCLTMNTMTRMVMSRRFFSYGSGLQVAGSDRKWDQAEVVGTGSCEALEFKHLVDEVVRLQVVPLIGDFVPYLGFLDRIKNHKADMKRIRQRLDAFLGRIISDHRLALDGGGNSKEARRAPINFIEVILSLPGEDGAECWTDDMIKGLLLDLLIGGTETSTVTVEWAMSELLKKPGALKAAQDELDNVVGRERAVTEADLPRLPYLTNVVKETFRLHPPLPLLIPHESLRACQVLGYDVPAGTRLLVNVWGMGRSAEVWDDPLSFSPSRFHDSDIDVRGGHFQLLPFGAARRGCPGLGFGLTMVQYALARLLQSFDWSLPRGQRPQDVDMAETFGLTLPKAKHMVATPTPRLPDRLYPTSRS